MEYAGKSYDSIELWIYPGADGDFSLYEDEGESCRYEQSAYAIISIHWDDGSRTLTINTRQGSYKGMPAGHTFKFVIVSIWRCVGGDPVATPDRVIRYTGAKLVEKS